MAIYTGGMRQKDEARAAAKRIASQQGKAQRGEAKRKGRAGIFGSALGLGLGTVAAGALGIATGGLAMPLVMGLASSLGKKFADDASQGKFGKQFKTSGQVGKIEAGGEYGYGREEAASLTKALEESRKTEFDLGTVATDIGSSYLSAGLSGGLSGAGKTLMSGKEGSLMESITGHAAGKGKFGWEGIKHNVGTMLGGQAAEEGVSDTVTPGIGVGKTFGEGTGMGVSSDPSGTGIGFQMPSLDLDPSLTAPITPTSFEVGDAIVDYSGSTGIDEFGNPYSMAQGGQVPQMDQHTMIGLALLSQMQQQQQQTAYSGTPLEEKQQPSSIADHFASQGKTLGGNNTQSLSQILGR